MSFPKLIDNQALECEGVVNENELLKALTSVDNDKTPRNPGITKVFFINFWDFLKEPLCPSIQESFLVGELSVSQKQATIKLIERKVGIKDLSKTGDLSLFYM